MKPSMILAAAVLFLSTSAVFAQQVKVDVDTTVNFATFKTFGWAEGPVARTNSQSIDRGRGGKRVDRQRAYQECRKP